LAVHNSDAKSSVNNLLFQDDYKDFRKSWNIASSDGPKILYQARVIKRVSYHVLQVSKRIDYANTRAFLKGFCDLVEMAGKNNNFEE